MRSAFITTLMDLARKDRRLFLLTGDLGFNVVEPFVRAHTDRFLNAGVAEQNMIGVATGLAESGLIPFCYSIANFASMRPYEFIRNGPVLHQWPVRIVGTGGGFDYGPAGPTHYALEDVGILRLQKGLTVVVPADREQVRSALLETWDLPRPVYYRISKEKDYRVPGLDGRFHLDSVYSLRDGENCVFVTMGTMANEVLKAAEMLAEKGTTCSVILVSSFNPSPDEALLSYLRKFSLAVTVEDHFVDGGLGSYVSELVSSRGVACRVMRCGVNQLLGGVSGSKAFMLDKYGLSAEKLTLKVGQWLSE